MKEKNKKKENNTENSKSLNHELEEQDTFKEIDAEICEQTEDFWIHQSQEERRHFMEQIDLSYHTIVNEFFETADLSTDKYLKFSKSNKRWRRWITVLAGMLAILNILVAYTTTLQKEIFPLLPLLAAVFASVIAIFSNLENLYKYADRAEAFGDVREISLNAAREYEMKWHVYVRPFIDNPKACMNAAKIYQQIIEKDQEIRGQTREMTHIAKKASAQE